MMTEFTTEDRARIKEIALTMIRLEALFLAYVSAPATPPHDKIPAPLEMAYLRTGDPALRRYSDEELIALKHAIDPKDRVAYRAWQKINQIEMARRSADKRPGSRRRADVVTIHRVSQQS